MLAPPAGRRMALVLLGVAVLAMTMLWLWPRLSGTPRVAGVRPAAGAGDVSTLTDVRLTLAAPWPAGRPLPEVTVEALDPRPAGDAVIPGTLRVDGDTLVWTPERPLAPETTYRAQFAGLHRAWRWSTGPLRALYLAPDDAGRPQIHALALGQEIPDRLTHGPQGVRDYAVAPEGDQILYSTTRADDGEDLWLWSRAEGTAQRLVDCAATPDGIAACREAAWTPDGREILYERHTLDGDAAGTDVTLWRAVIATGETMPLEVGGAPVHATAPRPSPDGRWLAGLDAVTQEVVLIDLHSGERVLLPGRSGLPVVWRPDGGVFLTVRLEPLEESVGTAIWQVDPASGAALALTPGATTQEQALEQAHPAWSPDGAWIAYGERAPGPGAGSPRQLLRVAASGGEGQALAADQAIHHGAPAWSPDGRLLLYSRHRWTTPPEVALLGVWDMESGEERLLPAAGGWTAWLP